MGARRYTHVAEALDGRLGFGFRDGVVMWAWDGYVELGHAMVQQNLPGGIWHGFLCARRHLKPGNG